MKPAPEELALLGYVNELSARPSETLHFKVSSTANSPVTASLVRSISADPNPAGQGIVEEDASAYFKPVTFPSERQPFYPGSYGIGANTVTAPVESSLTFKLCVYPTLRSNDRQALLNVGEHTLSLDSHGALCVHVGECTVVSPSALKLRCWHRIEVHIEGDVITVMHLALEPKSDPVRTIKKKVPSCALTGTPCIAARWKHGKALDHFNGKIEAPEILAGEKTVCGWDFSRAISTTTVPAISGPMLELVNFPTRAVTGVHWDGSEMNWGHKPSHPAAIHFHEDDIYDFQWKTSFDFRVPDNMPSGIYVMRLECGDNTDAIPFFIKPALGKPTAKLCVLISTFTYSIYGNHARPDFHSDWMKKTVEWGAYPHNPAQHPQYGLSTYNFHADGSGICHASHRRPLFNLRPGYVTFGNAACSGLRHFPADSHLISWLHARAIDYDVITDQDLHNEGSRAIQAYRAVTTGTHPEYHTAQTLDALLHYRNNGGHLLYLGGNGFYWRITVHTENDSLLEIRRAEDGIRAWASEPGEYYNAFDGTYGGLWRRNNRAPQALVGIGFAAQGEFFGGPYRRVCRDPRFDWVFAGIDSDTVGDFGFSGNGAAGFELDRMDYRIGTPENTVLLARSVTRDREFMLVPEEQLTHLTNLTGGSEDEAKHADMTYTEYTSGGSVFAAGSITFCGSLPWNKFRNNVSILLKNVLNKALNLVSS